VTAEFKKNGIGRSLTAVSHVFDKSDIFPIVLSKVFIKNEEISSEQHQTRMPPHLILTKLSYTHLEQLIRIDDELKRTFFEIECIKGTWSVRELKRQINSLYYERSGLSSKPEKLSELVNQKIIPQKPTDIIKNIYAFEFLDLKERELVEESDLETALLDHLQEFILELGNNFCFEARQKRILIGEEYYFIDLVFYHRLLKCHVLIDLKIGAFEHGDIGQLNTYLNFFKQEISSPDDNPPAGILLVAEKDHALVKYATAGIDENLFIQQYLVKLPGKNQLERYIENEMKKLQ
jgi:predicted nuclease of restriction endonuclease-like (RecB) superfamily